MWDKINKPIIAVAPMDGVTDYAFRSICKDNGADVLYTEFVSVDGIYHALDKMKTEMAFDDKQRPIICQLHGKDPAMFKHGAQVVEKMGFDGVDINFGCPSKRVVQHGSGVKLMTDFNKVRAIVEATLAGVKHIPVSLKIRAGIKDVKATDMIEHIKDLPFSAIMFHGRTYEQGLTGPIDLEQIKAVKKLVGDRSVLANGGISTPEIAKQVLDTTGVDGIGIGQGVLGRPWLLQQIKDYLKTGSYQEPDWDDIKKIILAHAKLIFKHKGDHGLLELRKHLGWYIKGIPNASDLRQKLVRVTTLKEIEQILKNLPK